MRTPLILGALAALYATPALADADTTPDGEVRAAVDRFFDAIRSDDKAELAEVMLPEGVIFVHSRMDPEHPRVDAVTVEDHLARWATRSASFDERMYYDTVRISGDMAQVWGPYSFMADGKLSHCGVNSLSLVKTDDGWKVGNTSFTMVPPGQCAEVGVDWVGE